MAVFDALIVSLESQAERLFYDIQWSKKIGQPILQFTSRKEELFLVLVKDYYKLRCVNVVWSTSWKATFRVR